MYRSTGKKSGQLLLYMILLLIVAGIMASLKECSSPAGATDKEVRASEGDTIDVAISYSPMTLYRYGDTLGGFSYDMIRLIADSTGMVMKFHPLTSLEKGIDGLNSGLYDLLIADVAKTKDFEGKVGFTTDVYLDRQVLVQRKDTAGVLVGNQLDLGGKKVWVEAESPAYLRLKNLSSEIGDTIFIEPVSDYNSEQLLMMTAVGEIDLAVVNAMIADKLAADYPQIDVSTGISFTQFQTWLTRPDDSTFLKRINADIERFKASPAYGDLKRRYGIE